MGRGKKQEVRDCEYGYGNGKKKWGASGDFLWGVLDGHAQTDGL